MTGSNCYGCNTRENLFWIWDDRGRSYPICKYCYETKPLYMGKERVK